MRTAAATHSHSTARNARSTGPESGPRHTASPTKSAIGTITRTRRPAAALRQPQTFQQPVSCRRSGPPPPEPRAARRSPTSCAPIRSHEYGSAALRAAAPSARRRSSSSSSSTSAALQGAASPGGTRMPGLVVVGHLRVALDVGGDDRRGAGEGACEHHAEALAAERRRDEQAGGLELGGQVVVVDAAEQVDPVERESLPARQPAHGERVGADQAQARAGPRVHLRPGARGAPAAPLRGSFRPMKTTLPLRPPGSASGGRSMPFGITSNGPPMCGSAARRADSETAIRWSIRLASTPQKSAAERVPAQPLARRVAGDDDRAGGGREGVGREHRRERLVHVDDVEALPLPDPAHAHERLRAEDDVRERGVGGDDHRPPDRHHVVRRPRVPALLRVQKPGEPPRRVVPHDDADVVTEPVQRARLVVGVLLHSAPERPGVGDDDADLHDATLPVLPD